MSWSVAVTVTAAELAAVPAVARHNVELDALNKAFKTLHTRAVAAGASKPLSTLELASLGIVAPAGQAQLQVPRGGRRNGKPACATNPPLTTRYGGQALKALGLISQHPRGVTLAYA